MDVDPVTTSYLSIVTYSLLATFLTLLIAGYYYIETSRTIRLIKKLPGMYILIIKKKLTLNSTVSLRL